MDKKYYMGASDALLRRSAMSMVATTISRDWHLGLLSAAIAEAVASIADSLGRTVPSLDIDLLAAEYEVAFNEAVAFGLFRPGGIRSKDHLGLWCLARVLRPDIYVESGVFIGSSLHAVISGHMPETVVAIDPNLTRLRVPRTKVPGGQFIDDQDFSQLTLNCSGQNALAYFDDHIDTAERILQSAQKGIRCIVFDDSTGMEGICQRLYPAVPTLPMIMNCDLLRAGQELCWSFTQISSGSAGGLLAQIARQIVGRGCVRVSFTVTDELIDKCHRAKRVVSKWAKSPKLGNFAQLGRLHTAIAPKRIHRHYEVHCSPKCRGLTVVKAKWSLGPSLCCRFRTAHISYSMRPQFGAALCMRRSELRNCCERQCLRDVLFVG